MPASVLCTEALALGRTQLCAELWRKGPYRLATHILLGGAPLFAKAAKNRDLHLLKTANAGTAETSGPETANSDTTEIT